MTTNMLLTERLIPGGTRGYIAGLSQCELQLQAFSVEIGDLNTVYLFGAADIGGLADRAEFAPLRASAAQVSTLVHRHGGAFSQQPPARIYELREYTPRQSEASTFLGRMVAAMAVREKYSPCSGIWTREVEGRMRILHLWGYRDLAHRDAARVEVGKESAWIDYSAYALSVLEHMRSDLVLPIQAR